ncbi:hypothetical protein V2S66_19700 [Streptomyces sp. V4-01]|uniref:Uncharacterized protein n=1 Tax=Actinacidiphila polyblastidii TaxID=3110430 RepID=A0ABU7PEE5_9ACTN|nr:hypothetical protein [Streptomyces sp. V4-01]
MLMMSYGSGNVFRRTTKPKVGLAIANMQPGWAVVVERAEDERPGDWYVQVLLRKDNTFQLEYRDGEPSQHFQTRTVSREKVIDAVVGWAKNDPAWKEAFMWNNIGAEFE